MNIADINPHIRFAEKMTYYAQNKHVYVKDCRLFYILGGEGKIFINGSYFLLNKHTLFYCCGGLDYTIEALKPMQLYSINFDLSQNHSKQITPFPPQDYAKSGINAPVESFIIKNSWFLNSFLILENGISFKNTIMEIIKEYSSQKNYFRESSSSTLKKLLTELHRTNISTPDSSYDTIKKITDYIELNFKNEIKNSELALIAGMHEYYLNRIFVKHVGISMHKYILKLRINESKYLLLNTYMPVSDIALQVGFNSYTHFVTYFKKETSMSPLKYRNNFKNGI